MSEKSNAEMAQSLMGREVRDPGHVAAAQVYATLAVAEWLENATGQLFIIENRLERIEQNMPRAFG